MKRILILGASGFIGNTLYKELNSYYDTFGTYFTKKGFGQNHHFFHFDMIQFLLNLALFFGKLGILFILNGLQFGFLLGLLFGECQFLSLGKSKSILALASSLLDAL